MPRCESGAWGWNDRPATAAELADMKAVVREAMEEGAWGLSTGLDYPPGSYADTAELSELSAVAASWAAFTTPTPGPACARKGCWLPGKRRWKSGGAAAVPIHLTHYRQSAQGLGSHLDYWVWWKGVETKGWTLPLTAIPIPIPAQRSPLACPIGPRTAARSG